MKFAILVQPPGDTTHKVYAMFGKPLNIDGIKFIQFVSDAPLFDGHFLQFRLLEPKGKQGLLVSVPVQHVVLMFGDDQNRKMGFSDA